MRAFLESDTGLYYLVGLFTIGVFLAALAVLAVSSPGGVGTAGLGGLVVGFSLFMVVYFVSITVYRLEGRDDP